MAHERGVADGVDLRLLVGYAVAADDDSMNSKPSTRHDVASGTAAAYVDRAAATLPEDIREQITRKREPGDPDAALDPLADPAVRAAVQRATFELLVGFQLTEAQLRYNATR